MKTCYTCQSRIEIRATRCPYCTTEVDFYGIARRPDPATRQPTPQYTASDSASTDTGAGHAILFFVVLGLGAWLQSGWPFACWIMFYILKFIFAVISAVRS